MPLVQGDTVSSILNNSLLCAHNQSDLYWLCIYMYSSLVWSVPAGMFIFPFLFNFLFLQFPGMDKLIAQFVKLNTKLNRKLPARVEIFRYFYGYWKWNLKFWVMSFYLPVGREDCLNVKNVKTFAVNWMNVGGIIKRRNEVTPDNTN